MSSVQHNHNSGLTINIYNPPPNTEVNLRNRGLTIDFDAHNTDIDDSSFGDDGGSGSAFDNLPLPAWAKAALKNLFGDANSNLPSSSDAAKSLRDFQKQNDIGLLSSDQVKQMADTGYITMPNGERELVPPDIQAAAQKMMANNGELFKKLETAIRPNHDGLLSAADYDAALKDGSIGKPGTADLPTEQALDMNAFLKFVMDGTISSNRPTEYNAAKTIQGFQQENNIKHLNIDQIQQMAETGYCTLPGGKTIQVPPDVQAGAQKMMENNGELFKKLETSIRKEHDGLLSTNDVDQAARDGLLNARTGTNNNLQTNGPPGNQPDLLQQFLDQLGSELMERGEMDAQGNFRDLFPSNDAGNGMPSSSNAAKSIHDFQSQHGIELLSSTQTQQMAETGYCTLPGGRTIQVPPEAQAAAMKMMDNNGDLYKKLESAITGNFDGLLSKADYHEAIKDGTIGQPGQNGPTGPTGPNASIPGNFNPATPINNGPLEKSEHGAIDSMWKFQKDVLGSEMLSREKVQQMADTGKLTKDNGVTMDVPKDVQESARTMMANNGALFDKIEVAHNGKKDGLIAEADFKPAWNQSIKDASTAIVSFQKSELKGEFITQAQMKEIAETGNLTKNDGSVVQVPQQVLDAARAYMDNDAKLFKDAESWQDNKHDNKLSVKDSEKRAAAAA